MPEYISGQQIELNTRNFKGVNLKKSSLKISKIMEEPDPVSPSSSDP